MLISYALVFFALGGFNLARLAWGDMKELLVDERISSLMTGVVLAFYLLEGRVLELIVVLFVSLFVLGWLKKRKWVFGVAEGDLSILSWVVSGLWFLGVPFVYTFLLLYVFGICVMRFIVVGRDGFPASVPISVAFCLTWVLAVLV